MENERGFCWTPLSEPPSAYTPDVDIFTLTKVINKHSCYGDGSKLDSWDIAGRSELHLEILNTFKDGVISDRYLHAAHSPCLFREGNRYKFFPSKVKQTWSVNY